MEAIFTILFEILFELIINPLLLRWTLKREKRKWYKDQATIV
ncbi:hypothetical protein ACTJKC_18090 [Pedobacter sp. 22226]